MKSSSSIRILSIAVVILIIANAVLLVLLWKEKNKHNERRPQPTPFETMVKEVNLTEQQKADYQKLRDDYLTNARPLFDSIREIRKGFTHIIQDSTVSDSVMESYSSRIAQKQVLVDKMAFEYFRKVRALFSGDQQKKYDNYLEKTMQQRLNAGRRRDSTNRR